MRAKKPVLIIEMTDVKPQSTEITERTERITEKNELKKNPRSVKSLCPLCLCGEIKSRP